MSDTVDLWPLGPGVPYNISVRALTVAGEGPAISETNFTEQLS